MSLSFAFIPLFQTSLVLIVAQKTRQKAIPTLVSRDSKLSATINHEFLTSEIYKMSTANVHNVVNDGTKHRNQDN